MKCGIADYYFYLDCSRSIWNITFVVFELITQYIGQKPKVHEIIFKKT